MSSRPASAIARGTLRHRRFTPMLREFTHGVTYFLVDLSEKERLFAVPFLFSHRFPAVFRFDESIYLEGRDPRPLDEKLRERVFRELGFRPDGKIKLLTQISSFGIGFNPVSFYFFFEAESEHLVAILTEITNTPWNERHSRVHDCRGQKDRSTKAFRFAKDFHVSPFLSMDYRYDWSFLYRVGRDITIQMNNHAHADDAKHFDATLSLELVPATRMNVVFALLRSPFMVLKTLFFIYAHALVLLMRKVRFHDHPNPPPKGRRA